MDFASIPIFNVMKAKLGYMSERQAVLAQNVANADTPRYRARDVTAPDFKTIAKTYSSASGKLVPKLSLLRTDAQHIQPQPKLSSPYQSFERPMTDELNPNGNNVVIEEEMAKVAENQAEYQKVLTLYGKTISLFKIAIGNSNGG